MVNVSLHFPKVRSTTCATMVLHLQDFGKIGGGVSAARSLSVSPARSPSRDAALDVPLPFVLVVSRPGGFKWVGVISVVNRCCSLYLS
jgi:hypothetical protein